MNEDWNSKRPVGVRIGDAERQLAADQLQQHYTAGRLTWDELDERLGSAWGARVESDVRGLFTDLPALAPAPPPPLSRSDKFRQILPVSPLLILLLVIGLAAVVLTDGAAFAFIAMFWFFGGFGHRAGRRQHGHGRHPYAGQVGQYSLPNHRRRDY